MSDADEAVRGILSKWAASLPGHPYADFAAKVSFAHVAEKPSFVVRLMTLYDSRGDPKDGFIPFNADAPPPAASADVWTQPSGLEADYIRHETRLALPVSAEPMNCPRCDGAGSLRCKTCTGTKRVPCPACTSGKKKACDQCGGLGKLACAHCQGKGMVVTGMSSTGRSSETACQACAGTGGPPCDKCSGGADCKTCSNERFVACKACSGAGGTPCPACEGKRQVLKARTYQIEYQPLFEREVRPDAESPSGLLPAELSRDVVGSIVYEMEGEKISELKDGLPRPDLKAAAEALLKKAEAGVKGFALQTKIIRQKLTIDRIPAYSAVYEHGGKRYACWATTLNNKVVAPESPFSELAGQWIVEAQTSLGVNGVAKAEELMARAAALAPWPWVDAVKAHLQQHKGLAAAQSGPGLDFALACAATLALAAGHRSSHNLFWPAAAFFALTFAGARAVAALAKGKKGSLLGLLGGPLLIAVAAVAVWLANPFARLDAREYEALLNARFGASLPGTFSADDRAFLKVVTGLYEPLGADTAAALAAVEAADKRAEAERLEAQRAEEEKKKAEAEALKKEQEAEALRRAIRPSMRFKSSPVSKKSKKTRTR